MAKHKKFWWREFFNWVESAECPFCGRVFKCSAYAASYSCWAKCPTCHRSLQVVDSRDRCKKCTSRLECLSKGNPIVTAKILGP